MSDEMRVYHRVSRRVRGPKIYDDDRETAERVATYIAKKAIDGADAAGRLGFTTVTTRTSHGRCVEVFFYAHSQWTQGQDVDVSVGKLTLATETRMRTTVEGAAALAEQWATFREMLRVAGVPIPTPGDA